MHASLCECCENNPLSYNNSQIDQSIDFTRSVSNDHNNTMVVQFSSRSS